MWQTTSHKPKEIQVSFRERQEPRALGYLRQMQPDTNRGMISRIVNELVET